MARNPEPQRAWKERNREKIRVWNREYAAHKRREAGMPALGTPESTENRRNARKLAGEEHPNWKGREVGYAALHRWVYRHKTKTGICSACGISGLTDWANLSGTYQRDLDDFIELCRSCHKRLDLRRIQIHG